MEVFYYKQFQVGPPKEGEDKPTITEVEDGFNIETVHRTRRYPDGSMIVLLNDGHETNSKKQLKNGGEKDERKWVQSEIQLMPEDAARLIEITKAKTQEEWDAYWDKGKQEKEPIPELNEEGQEGKFPYPTEVGTEIDHQLSEQESQIAE